MIKGAIRKISHLLTLLLMAAIATGCGGGGGGNDNGFTGSNQQPEPDYTLELTLTDAQGDAITELSSGESADLEVSVLDGDAPVSGTVVTLTISGATANQSSSTTDSEGRARFVITAGDTAGAATITASVDGREGTVESSVSFNVNAPTLAMTLTDSSGTAVTELESSEAANLVVTVTDGNGPVLGAVVAITVTGATSDQANRTTDDQGEARFIITAGDTAGAATIVASISGQEGSAEASLSFNVTVSIPTITLELTGLQGEPIAEISPTNKGLLRTTLLSADGTGVPDQIVTASVTVGTLAPESGTALTDGNGYTYFIIEADGTDGAGTATVSFGTGDQTFSAALNFSISSTLPYRIENRVLVDGEVTNTVETGSQFDLEVLVTDVDSEQPVANQLISVAVGELGSLIPTAGTAVTNAEGVAAFKVVTGSQTGAFTIESAAVFAGGNLVEQSTLTVVQADRRVGYFDATGAFVEGALLISPDKELSPAGTAAITFAVVDDEDQRVKTEEILTLNSECLFSSKATLDPTSPITFIGQATVLYTASGCTGTDNITATLTSTGAEASGSITMAEAVAETIRFEDATPNLIAIRGTGSASDLTESSLMTFKVTDLEGNPVTDSRVNFSLEQNTGGIALYCAEDPFCTYADQESQSSGRSARSTDLSDLDGIVTARVLSGYVATPVRVLAYVDINNNDIQDEGEPTSISKSLVVSTGLPDQNSVSVSASVLNVEGAFEADGRSSVVTVRMADKYNNPVPDQTPVTFTTELGSVIGSCETEAGSCSVTWTSQAPRISDVVDQYSAPITIFENLDITTPGRYDCPSHDERGGPCPDDIGDEQVNPPGAPRGGRTTILATAIGEESFVDANANGIYDSGEFWTNLTEAFRDDNEDGLYTPAQRANCSDPSSADDVCLAGFEEIFVDYNFNGAFDLNDQPASDSANLPDGLFNGVLCQPDAEAAGICSRELLNVRDSVVIVNSFSDANNFSLLAIGSDRYEPKVLRGGRTYTLYVSDYFNNSPPANSEISYEGSGRCDVITPSPTIGDSNKAGAFAVSFAVSTADGEEPSADPDQVSIILTLPGGSKTVKTYACFVIDPPDEADCGFSPLPPECQT